jgi:hypothetical protein
MLFQRLDASSQKAQVPHFSKKIALLFLQQTTVAGMDSWYSWILASLVSVTAKVLPGVAKSARYHIVFLFAPAALTLDCLCLPTSRHLHRENPPQRTSRVRPRRQQITPPAFQFVNFTLGELNYARMMGQVINISRSVEALRLKLCVACIAYIGWGI